MSTANIMNKWRVELYGSSGGGAQRSIIQRKHDLSANPPGFSLSAAQSEQNIERTHSDQQQRQQLMTKRAWDM